MRRPFSFQQIVDTTGLPAAIRWMNARMHDLQQAIPVQLVVDLRDFSLDSSGQSDVSTTLQQAVNEAAVASGANTLVEVKMPPNATFLCGDLVGASYVHLVGSGKSSTLQMKTGAQYLFSVNPGTGGTTSVADNAVGVGLRNIRLRGLASTLGFSEHVHLVNWNAVSDGLLHTVWLSAMQGDGFYLGSSNAPNTERHNERITVRNLWGDGEVNAGRNLISVIDCDTFTATGIYGTRVSSVGMPGIIDIEPDRGTVYPVIKNIAIRHVRVRDNVGGAAVAITLPDQTLVTTPTEGISVRDVVADAVTIGLLINSDTSAMTANTIPQQIEVDGMTVRNAAYPFVVDAVKGLSLSHFAASDCTGSAQLSVETLLPSLDVQFDDVALLRCGTTDATKAGLRVGEVNGWVHRNLRLIDCGASNGSGGTGIVFSGAYTGQRITSEDCRITSPTGKTTNGVTVSGGYTLLRDTCTERNYRNEAGGSNDFVAREAFVSGAPASGTWTRGARVYEQSPASAGYIGYVCTASGTPGTWKGFGVIA
jgi:hypothetical protein